MIEDPFEKMRRKLALLNWSLLVLVYLLGVLAGLYLARLVYGLR